jgi:tellurite resistance protein TehA-like permease
MVMATGIVSVAMHEEQRGARSAVGLASTALAGVAAAAFAVLAALYGARMVAAAPQVRAELANPTTGFDFFAFVAAVDVLGVRAAGAGRPGIGRVLWTVGALAWLVLLLALPLAMAARSRAATLAGGSPAVAASAVVPTRRRRGRAWSAASGNWLLPVVATQSLAVLAGMLARPGRAELEPLLLVALGCWLLGLALYVALLAGIVVRALASPPTGMRFTPDDWIVMGALAISTLAATQLLRAGQATSCFDTSARCSPMPPASPGHWRVRRSCPWRACTCAGCCETVQRGAIRPDGGRACSRSGCTAWPPTSSRSRCTGAGWSRWPAAPRGSP